MNRYCGAPAQVAVPLNVTLVPVGCGDALSTVSDDEMQEVNAKASHCALS